MTQIEISIAREKLTEGRDYETATFGLLEIKGNGKSLSAAIQNHPPRPLYLPGPYVPGYYLAEWLCWNWWRLRWEPRVHPDRPPTFEWDLAHRMSDIGQGYLWPNITISCDGLQCEITAARSNDSDTPLFSYLGSPTVTVPAIELESAIDAFLCDVVQLLEDAKIANTNLQVLWEELNQERKDSDSARIRRIEALLGRDPDEIDGEIIENWLLEAASLGENAMAELATAPAASLMSANQINELSTSEGFHVERNDGFSLAQPFTPRSGNKIIKWGDSPAWRMGIATAKAVREQAKLGEDPIEDAILVQLAGASNEVAQSDRSTRSVSWVYEPEDGRAQMALRPWVHTARRFDIARLIGDCLFLESRFTPRESLIPATNSYSYRQKAQRAFAAELLSPWTAVQGMLEDDYSQEHREQVALHFGVSPYTIDNLIRSNLGPNHPEGSEYSFN